MSSIPPASADPIIGVGEAFRSDKFDGKVNLSVGAYRDNRGEPFVFRAVRQVEEQLAGALLDKEYLPIDGLQALKKPTQQLMFGCDSSAIRHDRICSIQSISGSGALRLAGELVLHHINSPKVAYISRPSWPIHKQMFEALGFTANEYPYWLQDKRTIDVKAMVACLDKAAEGSLVILHACAHNPTGMDPTRAEWNEIVDVVKRRRLIPLLDTAYQGFASGSLDDDAFAIRLFEQSVSEMFVCQSFAKNLGLYGERVGMLHVVCQTTITSSAFRLFTICLVLS
eukprot:GHVS01098536.1.p1 GENE.GHVS01098536.1~~GHVS01098536.1.p1  ORF type:complete len:330 (-),score=72.91 GHVS01098536.1:26-874(-)